MVSSRRTLEQENIDLRLVYGAQDLSLVTANTQPAWVWEYGGRVSTNRIHSLHLLWDLEERGETLDCMVPADTFRLPQEVVEMQDKLENAEAAIQLKTGQVAALSPFSSF